MHLTSFPARKFTRALTEPLSQFHEWFGSWFCDLAFDVCWFGDIFVLRACVSRRSMCGGQDDVLVVRFEH